MAFEAGEIVARLKADTSQFVSAMQKSTTELTAIGSTSVAIGNLASQAFTRITEHVINATSAAVRWAQQAAEAAEKTQLLSLKLGVSERVLEGWGVSLSRVGLSQESLSTGMVTLSRRIEELGSGNQTAIELFEKLNTGLSNAEIAGLGTEKIIRLMADRFSTMADGTEKAYLAQELLGRSGLNLIPILNKGSIGLDQAAKDAERFGLVLSQTQREALLQYDDALDDLSSALEGFKTQVGAAFAPSLTRTIEMMTSAVSYAKSIFTEFANAAEKLFIRFGAIAAVIELVGKQVFSLSALNKQAWEQTMQQIKAIDAWAASEIKAVDASKNSTVQMATATSQSKTYKATQEQLGQAIVNIAKSEQAHAEVLREKAAAVKSFNDAVAASEQQSLGRNIVQQAQAQQALFDAEQEGLGRLIIEREIATQKQLQIETQFQQALAASEQESIGRRIVERTSAQNAELEATIAFNQKVEAAEQESLGRRIVEQSIAAQKMKFVWPDLFGSMSQSAQLAFGQIRASFGNTVADLAEGTANWRQMWMGTQRALINSSVQWGIDVVGSFLAKNAMILATESVTAAGVMSIWTGTAAAVTGTFGAMSAAIATFFTATIAPMFAAVGEAVMAFLAAIATSLDISIFGAPFSIPVWAAVGLVAAAVGVISAFAFGAFAEGGIVKGPMMGLVGEAGPEAIIPLDQLSSIMGSGETTVIVELDGRTIARTVFDNMPSIMRVRGVSA